MTLPGISIAPRVSEHYVKGTQTDEFDVKSVDMESKPANERSPNRSGRSRSLSTVTPVLASAPLRLTQHVTPPQEAKGATEHLSNLPGIAEDAAGGEDAAALLAASVVLSPEQVRDTMATPAFAEFWCAPPPS